MPPSELDPDITPARVIEAHHAARQFYRDQLRRAGGPRQYLTGRGLGRLTRQDGPWHLGYAPPGWGTLVDHLKHLDFSPTELVAAGLATTSRRGTVVDRFRERIVFPIHSLTGDPIAFIGRASPGVTPKYLNSPDTITYHKGQTLYGHGEQLDLITAGAAPFWVEGPFDVLAVATAHPEGTHVAVASCGTALTEEHATSIVTMPGATSHGITTAFDNDTAGHRATERAWRLLTQHEGPSLYAATLSAAADPGDLDASSLRRALTDGVRPLAHTVIDNRLDQLIARLPDLMRWIDSRVAAVRSLVGLIAHLPAHDLVPLTGYIAERTGTDLTTVAGAVISHLERPSPSGTRLTSTRTLNLNSTNNRCPDSKKQRGR